MVLAREGRTLSSGTHPEQHRRRGGRQQGATDAREQLGRELRMLGVSCYDEARLCAAVAAFVVALRAEGLRPEEVVKALRGLLAMTGGAGVTDTLKDRLVSHGIKAHFEHP